MTWGLALRIFVTMLLLYSAIFPTFLSPKPEILYSFHLLPCALWCLCSPPAQVPWRLAHRPLCVSPSFSFNAYFLSPLSVVVQSSCRTLCDPMDCSTSGFPVPPHLPEFAQVHVHWVGDAIQPSLSPCPPALNLSQHQGLFQWKDLFTSGGQSIGVSALVLPMSIQGWFPLRLTALISFSPYICANPTPFLKAQSKCVLSHRVFLHPVRECWQWLPCACHTVMNKMVPNLEQCKSWMNEADKSADDSIWCCPAFFFFSFTK